MSTEYILCAAVWFKDGKEHEHQPVNIDSGYVVCGRRHHNVFTTHAIVRRGAIDPGILFLPPIPHEQGFITSMDRFVDRKEAGEIAFSNGQVMEHYPKLYSEHLY